MTVVARVIEPEQNVSDFRVGVAHDGDDAAGRFAFSENSRLGCVFDEERDMRVDVGSDERKGAVVVVVVVE